MENELRNKKLAEIMTHPEITPKIQEAIALFGAICTEIQSEGFNMTIQDGDLSWEASFKIVESWKTEDGRKVKVEETCNTVN